MVLEKGNPSPSLPEIREAGTTTGVAIQMDLHSKSCSVSLPVGALGQVTKALWALMIMSVKWGV